MTDLNTENKLAEEDKKHSERKTYLLDKVSNPILERGNTVLLLLLLLLLLLCHAQGTPPEF